VLFQGAVAIQVRYFNLIREGWPQAEWYGNDGEHSVIAKVNDQPIAMVMPVRLHGREVEIEDTLRGRETPVPCQDENHPGAST
jgi:hypothetical protein